MTDFRRVSPPVERGEWVAYQESMGLNSAAAEASWGKFVECEFYENDVYVVQLDKSPQHQFRNGEVWQLWIARRDGSFERNRDDLMSIKDRIVGEEVEAVELYPSEQRLNDAANRTSLFCFIALNGTKNPRFPAGPAGRTVGFPGQH